MRSEGKASQGQGPGMGGGGQGRAADMGDRIWAGTGDMGGVCFGSAAIDRSLRVPVCLEADAPPDPPRGAQP